MLGAISWLVGKLRQEDSAMMQTTPDLQGSSYLGHNLNSCNLNRDGGFLAPRVRSGTHVSLPSVFSCLRGWLIIFLPCGMPLLKVVKGGQPRLHSNTIYQSMEFMKISEIKKWGDLLGGSGTCL